MNELRNSNRETWPVEQFERQHQRRIRQIRQDTPENMHRNNPLYKELEFFLSALISEDKGTPGGFDLWAKKCKTVSENAASQQDLEAIDFFVEANKTKLERFVLFEEMPSQSHCVASASQRNTSFDPILLIEQSLAVFEQGEEFPADQRIQLWQSFLENLSGEEREAVQAIIITHPEYAQRIENLYGIRFEERQQAHPNQRPVAVRNQARPLEPPIEVLNIGERQRNNHCFQLLLVLAAVVVGCTLPYFSKAL